MRSKLNMHLNLELCRGTLSYAYEGRVVYQHAEVSVLITSCAWAGRVMHGKGELCIILASYAFEYRVVRSDIELCMGMASYDFEGGGGLVLKASVEFRK